MTQHTVETETGFAAKDSRGNVNSCSDFGLRACAGRETESAKGKKKSSVRGLEGENVVAALISRFLVLADASTLFSPAFLRILLNVLTKKGPYISRLDS